MGATQKSIAAELGISRQLVGFALSNHPGVSAETRQRVLTAAERLGYDAFANRDARALIAKRYGRRVRTGIVAILLPPEFEVPLRDIPNFSQILDGIEREADRRSLDVLLCRTRKGQLPRMIQSQYVDGVACISTTPETMKMLNAFELPVVNLGRQTPGARWICPDDRAGIALTVKHLVDLGHRRFAYVGHDAKDKNGNERLTAYKSALKAASIPFSENLIEATVVSQTLDAGAAAMKQLLSRDASFQKTGAPSFTALVAYNDMLGMGAMRQLQECGIRIPEDVSVTGYGDISTQYALRPLLTTITFSRDELGTRAITLLSESDGPLKPGGEKLPVTLKIRESSCAAAAHASK